MQPGKSYLITTFRTCSNHFSISTGIISCLPCANLGLLVFDPICDFSPFPFRGLFRSLYFLTFHHGSTDTVK